MPENGTLPVQQTERKVYLDYLRVAATFAVIFLHAASQNWYSADPVSFQWQIINFYDSLVRWVVPVFIMISGALFLNRDIPLKKLYGKYVLRMVLAFVVWSAIYTIFAKGSFTERLSGFFFGHYHMWYILLLLGLYICQPLLRQITKNEKAVLYFLILALILAVIVPFLTSLVKDFGSEGLNNISDALNRQIRRFNIHMVLGYAGYFVLGYYLSRIRPDRKQKILITVGGILGFLATVFLTVLITLQSGEPDETYFGHFTINVLLTCIAVFVWFQPIKGGRAYPLVQKISGYCFGIFLVHPLILELFDHYLKFNTLSFHPALSVPVLSLVVFLISLGISALLNQIPFVKNYFV